MGNAATIDIRGNNKQLKSAFDESANLASAFGSKVVGILGAAAAAMAAAFAVRKIVSWGAEFLAAAGEAAEAEAVLSAALEATGNQTGFTLDQLNQLSLGMQQHTKFSQEAVQGAMAVITTFKNIRGDHFKEATELAADMATVLKSDLQGAAMQVAKALNDPVQGITALSRAGVSFTTTQKDMINEMIKSGDVMGAQKIILDELKSEFGGAAEKVGKTFAGQMEIMSNRVGDLSEGMGNNLIPVIDALGPAIDTVITFMENMIPVIGEMITGWIEFARESQAAVAPFFEFLVDVGLSAFTVLQTIIENFTNSAMATLLTFELAAVSSFSEIYHFLTVVLPEGLSWFANNWTSIFVDVGNFIATVLTNMGKNIGEFLVGVQNWLMGNESDFMFTGLTDGFEATLKELPKIAERIPSEIEKSLVNRLGELGSNLGNKFAKNFADNKAAFDGMFKPANTVDKNKIKPENVNKEFDTEGFKSKDSVEKKESASEKKLAALIDKRRELLAKLTGDAESGGGGIEDFKSLHNRIQSAAAGTGDRDKVLKEQLKIQQELLEVNKEIEAHGGDAMTNWANTLAQFQKEQTKQTPDEKAIALDKSLEGSSDWWEAILKSQEQTAMGIDKVAEETTQQATTTEETSGIDRKIQAGILSALNYLGIYSHGTYKEIREQTIIQQDQLALLPGVGALK